MSRTSTNRIAISFALAVALIGTALVETARSDVQEDQWQPLRRLIGDWVGTGTGFGSVSDVTHEWKLAIDDQFLELRTLSIPQGDSNQAEIHEDIGFISRDSGEGVFTFRQFLSEGFVITYDISFDDSEPGTIVFGFREAENTGGLRVQMSLTFVSDDEYEMVLELAAPGKGFSACQTMQMKRAKVDG